VLERYVIREVRTAGMHNPCKKRITSIKRNEFEKNMPSSVAIIIETEISISLLAEKACSRNPYITGANPRGRSAAVIRRDAVASLI
jgi:hypothetical protein